MGSGHPSITGGDTPANPTETEKGYFRTLCQPLRSVARMAIAKRMLDRVYAFTLQRLSHQTHENRTVLGIQANDVDLRSIF